MLSGQARPLHLPIRPLPFAFSAVVLQSFCTFCSRFAVVSPPLNLVVLEVIGYGGQSGYIPPTIPDKLDCYRD